MDAPWPEKPRVIGSRVTPVDGAERVGGGRRRPGDLVLPRMLHAALVVCPHGRARVVSIDAEAARRLPGFRGLFELRKKGDEVFHAAAPVVAVAADTAVQASDAARAVKVVFDRLPWTVQESDALAKDDRTAPPLGATRERWNLRAGAAIESAAFEVAVKTAEQVVATELRIAAAFASGEESSAAVARWVGNRLAVWASPGASAAWLENHFGLGANSVASRGEGAETLAACAAGLAKELDRPVKLVWPDRSRILPGLSSAARVGGKKDGTVLTFDAELVQADGPAILLPPTYSAARRVKPTVIRLNRDEAPASPALAGAVVECAVDDYAAAVGVDPLDVRRRSLPPDSPLRAALDEAARRCGWKENRHEPGKSEGAVKHGLALALADWPVAGTGRASATVTIYPDGSVVLDGPPGWTTPSAVLVAEALGIDPHEVEVRESRPAGGPDAVARAIWAAASAARAELLMKAGASSPWRAACTRLGKAPAKGEAAEAGKEVRSVPGAFAAEVRVDTETGVVRVVRVIAVQEAGRLVERQASETEVERAVFAGVARATCNEAVFDRQLGRRVGGPPRPRLADAPRVEVHLLESAPAVVRLAGEAVGAIAAVANAVRNAVGVRVPGLPLTPDRVLAALTKGG